MTTNPKITDAAVEAAARAVDPEDWDDHSDEVKQGLREIARGQLEAALPHMQQAGVAHAALDGKYGDVLRPFVAAMEHELHANAGKGDRPGWLAMSADTALLEIYYHLGKLQKAVRKESGPLIQEYAADVANMSMMLLDICGGLALIGDDPTAQATTPAQPEAGVPQ